MVLWVRPTKLLDQLRCIFWARVYEARALNVPIQKTEILTGFVDSKTWDALIDNEKNLAYLVRPIPRIEAAFEALMWRALRHLLEWIDTPINFAQHSVQEQRSLLQTLMAVVNECEQRLHPPSQRDIATQRRVQRNILIEELKKEKAEFNVPQDEETRLEQFDLDLLPDEDIFGEIGNTDLEGHVRLRSEDGRGSNTGYEDDPKPDERFEGRAEDEEDSDE